MDLVQIKIKKDNNVIKYISLIRKFDSSISISDIKKNIENNDFVVVFDLEYYDVIEDIEGVDRKVLFRQFIAELLKGGADIKIYRNSKITTLKLLDNWLNTLKEISKQTQIDIDRELGEI
ncbi:hypothetical protein UT300005_03720 [Clostridium sp. CTA-5]